MVTTLLSKKIIVPAAILFGGLLIASGILISANFTAAQSFTTSQASQWTQETGAGVMVPACASAVTSLPTCVGGVAQATISWTDPDGHGSLVNLDVCEGSWCPLIVYTPAGMFNGGGWDSFTLPAAGEVLLRPLKDNTTYVYALRDTSGTVVAYPTFATPLDCAPPSPLTASCSVSPTSANIGEDVIWSASASGGTGSYSYTWSGTDGLSGSTENFNIPGTSTWTVPSGVTQITVDAWGAGGGGGGGISGSFNGGGAGGGGYGKGTFSVTPMAQYVVTVGAGGTGATFNTGPGSAGGTSGFGTLISAMRGGGGGNSVGGSGGTSAAPINSAGGTGANGATQGAGGAGGAGGNGGVGGNGATSGVSGQPGTAPGGGGGGSANVAQNGGNGAPGRVAISPTNIQKSYSTGGTKSGNVDVSDGVTTANASCGTVTVNAPPSFDYNLSNSGLTSVTKTGSTEYTTNVITKTRISGTSESVTLSVSGLPSGVSVSGISNQNCSPNCTSVITLAVTPSAPVGDYTIIVTGTPFSGAPIRTTQFTLRITGSPFSVSCLASPSPALLGQAVTWTATISGGTPPLTYSWSGTNIPTSPAPNTNPFSISYSTIGQKTATVKVTDTDSVEANCPASTVQINFDPNFEEF